MSRVPSPVLGAITVCVAAWASAFIVIRGVGPHFSGGALALARLLVGTVLLGLVALRRPWVRPTPREWLLLLGFGVGWFGAYNVALNLAERSLDAGTAAMAVNIGPVLLALGAGTVLGEGISGWLALGAAVAFSGVVLIGLGSGGAQWGDGAGLGWALLAAVSYALGVLCQKVALRRLPVAQVTWLGCTFGMIACLPFGGELMRNLHGAPGAAILGVLYLGAVPTALAFSMWAYALSRMPVAQLGVTTYIVPAIVILLGRLFFREHPTPLGIAGGAICLVGVALSRRGGPVRRP